MQFTHSLVSTKTLPWRIPDVHCRRIPPPTSTVRFSPISAVAAAPPKPQKTHSMPPEKQEIFKSLENWATQNVLPLLKPVKECWQPQTFLPDPALPLGEFNEQVKALRQRTADLPDEYFVVLVGDMITEEALPTYQTMINTLDGTFLYLSGRVDMLMIERTVQYLIGSGMDPGTENNPYLGFVYTSFQERATFVSHGNTARLAKEDGDPVLARICGTIAADEKRHELAYSKIIEKLLQVDPTEAMLAIADMMKKKITMPAHLMYDGEDPRLFEHFSAVAQRLGVYTADDYADILEALIKRWGLEKMEGLTGEGRRAQDFVCGLAPRIRKLQERAEARAKKIGPQGVKFSWIFNREIML
ncbi:hypothetical protein GOBAR_DD23790 [Gossypium barbadense]|nr:hypothetical protein GOBAR_DD23790 [Gossypium barbadense]